MVIAITTDTIHKKIRSRIVSKKFKYIKLVKDYNSLFESKLIVDPRVCCAAMHKIILKISELL